MKDTKGIENQNNSSFLVSSRLLIDLSLPAALWFFGSD